MAEKKPLKWITNGTLVYATESRVSERGKTFEANRFSFFVQRDGSSATTEELEGVARLAGAAPDLLEALKGYVDFVSCPNCQDIEMCEDCADEYAQLHVAARAAIAKAQAEPA